MTTAADLIAAFLSRKSVTKVAEGVRTYDERQMYKAVRGETPVSIDEQNQRAYARWEHEVQEDFVSRHG